MLHRCQGLYLRERVKCPDRWPLCGDGIVSSVAVRQANGGVRP